MFNGSGLYEHPVYDTVELRFYERLFNEDFIKSLQAHLVYFKLRFITKTSLLGTFFESLAIR